MGRIVGIDLGTTNSLIAHHDGERARIIPLPGGEVLLPSVVAVDPIQGLLVGRGAREGVSSRPETTIFSVKRHMGTESKFFLGGEELRPQDISALILKELKRSAEAHLLSPVDRAVISVPAYFNDPQRRATREAGEMAGLQVERLVSEPTAAALAFGLDHLETEDHLLVYDLGGGTFDVTVLEMFEGIFNVRASSGDTRLGGDDFDSAILEWLLANAGPGLPREDLTPPALALLRRAAEKAKIALSSAPEARIQLDDVPLQGGRPGSVSLTLDRRTLEKLTRSLLERTGTCVARALAEARLPKEKIGEVILVGGPTKMPMVRSYLEGYFGRPPRASVDPMQAVALGAAIQASLLDTTRTGEGIVVTDVSPFTLGVAVLGEVGGEMRPGVFDPLITRNCSLPATRTKVYSTVHPDQDTVTVEVYQGDDPLVENDVFLDRYFLGGIPRGTGKPESIEITFRYDSDGILHVNAAVLSTGKSAGIRIDGTRMRAVGQGIAAARAKVEALWRSSEARRALSDLVEKVEKGLGSTPPEWRARIEEKLAAAREALRSREADGARLEELIGDLSRWVEGGGHELR